MKNVLMYEVSTMVPDTGIRLVHFSTVREPEAVRHAQDIHGAAKRDGRVVIPDIMVTERKPVNHVGKAPYWKAGKKGKIELLNPRIDR